MNISVKDLGKRYNFDWILRDISYTFLENSTYAITGPNGSGKSTLAKILASFTLPTEGEIKYITNNTVVEAEEIYKHINFAAPYIELIEEFTLKELYNFHFKFKKCSISGLEEFGDRTKLVSTSNKQIKFYSSGMKQRIKLGFAFFGSGEIVILDEPTSNLDVQGSLWYFDEIKKIIGSKLLLICSNQRDEYVFCSNVIDIGKK